MYEKLFSPIMVGNLRFKNRVVFPPISTNLASMQGEITPEFVYHYGRRAKGGASMIIIENLCIQYPDARHGATQPRIDDDSFIPGLSKIAYEVHKYGAYLFAELTHPGAMSNIKLAKGKPPVAPSALDIRPDHVIPKELTEEEIYELADIFAQAALRAKRSYMDGVEIEAAHGLLVNQFLSPFSNKRKDKFGGSVENRVRFSKLIIDRIHELCGNDFVVTARLGVKDFVENGLTSKEAVEIAKAYEEMGYKALHGDVGFGPNEKRLEPMQYPEAWRTEYAEVLKKGGVNIPIVAVGMIRCPETAEKILESDRADLIGLGRTLLADPDWPIKAESGREKEIRKCIGCSECILARHHEGSSTRCGFNPTVGKRESEEILIPALEKKKILVVGAGPGGLEAAITLKRRGHKVTIWEKKSQIGGNVRLGSVPPGKEKLTWMIDYYDYMIRKLNIEIQFNKEANVNNILDFNPNAVVVATGSKPIIPPIKGINNPKVLDYVAILEGKYKNIKDQRVVVGGGGLVGCETAQLLAQQNQVSLIEMLPELAIGTEPISRGYLMRELNSCGIKAYLNYLVKEIDDDYIIISSKEGIKRLPYDTFVVAFGGKPDRSLYEKLQGKVERYFVGDAFKVTKIIDAVQTGYAIGKII